MKIKAAHGRKLFVVIFFSGMLFVAGSASYVHAASLSNEEISVVVHSLQFLMLEIDKLEWRVSKFLEKNFNPRVVPAETTRIVTIQKKIDMKVSHAFVVLAATCESVNTRNKTTAISEKVIALRLQKKLVENRALVLVQVLSQEPNTSPIEREISLNEFRDVEVNPSSEVFLLARIVITALRGEKYFFGGWGS